MEIKYEIYSTLIESIRELSEAVTKNLREITHGTETFNCGWKIGEVTVTLPKDKDKIEVRKQLEEVFNKKIPNQTIWLKEVSHE